MEQLYKAAGTTRQAFHEWMKPGPREDARTDEAEVLVLARRIRKQYLPGASARTVHFFINKRPDVLENTLVGWGKHRFERLCLANGFRVVAKRFVPKTTQRGAFVFPNLIAGMTITGINQVWASDICYVFGAHGNLLGYAISLIDLYSRRLLGLAICRTMQAVETSMRVIRQAVKVRGKGPFKGLIFHSDGGKQYIYAPFLKALKKIGAGSSMAGNCLENGFAEAFNDILKNHVLNQFELNSFSQLKKQEGFILKTYNEFRPHGSLGKMTPIQFEQHLLSLQPYQRTKLLIKVID